MHTHTNEPLMQQGRLGLVSQHLIDQHHQVELAKETGIRLHRD
jgi:hypothetical protein